MSISTEIKLPKWPFLCGDAILVGVAAFITWQSTAPLGHWEIALALLSCIAGAVLLITPFLLEYQAVVRLSEAENLTSAADQLKNLELLAVQISAATAQWQMVQELSGKTVGTAKEIAERMAAETSSFTEFVQKANDAEKANLRLEVEKLRRSEGDWLQVAVRQLDHIYALHQAGLRSGQRALIEQLGHFQTACRDVARRIGLVPVTPAVNDDFNPQLHQLADADAKPQAGAKINEIIATGYTFQGRPLRPALVTLHAEDSSGKSADQGLLEDANEDSAELTGKPGQSLL
jgi:molecular chaperone GrpE (heat shock protein)